MQRSRQFFAQEGASREQIRREEAAKRLHDAREALTKAEAEFEKLRLERQAEWAAHNAMAQTRDADALALLDQRIPI